MLPISQNHFVLEAGVRQMRLSGRSALSVGCTDGRFTTRDILSIPSSIWHVGAEFLRLTQRMSWDSRELQLQLDMPAHTLDYRNQHIDHI